MSDEAAVVVVMGVTGSGKSTVGQALATRLGWRFQEGDDLHPPGNVAKMAAGRPLTDEDRAPWLDAIADRIDAWLAEGNLAVVTCSALKRSYRDRLRRGRARVRFVHLRAEPALVSRRLATRRGHFMPPSLVASQFEAFESPGEDEAPIVVEADRPTDELVETIVAALTGRP